MISKRDTLVNRECKGVNNQVQKLQESRKSRKEENDWFCKVANQSNKVLKENNLRYVMNFSLSSKHLLFLSLQWHHIKKWGTINHIWPFRWRSSLPCQQARPTTDCSITQLIPNKPKTIDHKSIATGQLRKRWSTYILYDIGDGSRVKFCMIWVNRQFRIASCKRCLPTPTVLPKLHPRPITISFGKTVGVGRHLLLSPILNCLDFAKIRRQVLLSLWSPLMGFFIGM